MKKKKYYLFSMDTLLLNVLSIVLIVILVGLLLVLFPNIIMNIKEKDMLLILVLMVPYFMLHEVFHSIAYVLYGANFKNITYGIHLEKGILCCLCKQNISKKNILMSLMFPFMWLGVVTLIIGLLYNSFVLVCLSIMNISGCTGDIIMFIALSKIKGFEFSEYDNPISFGLYSNDDLSKNKHFGLKYVESKNELERNDYKKIRVSKSSIIFLLIYYLIVLIDIFL